MAKIYICYAYRSVPVRPPNYHALGIKWRFSGDTGFTYLVDTCLPTGRKSVLGIFYRIIQAAKGMMIHLGYYLLVVSLDDSKDRCHQPVTV